jgi:5-methyltetrahydropteroyltriglutamate--homocysteine methyltransferase
LDARLTGFEGESARPLGTGDAEFPELAALLRPFASPFQRRPACTGPVTWKDWPAVEADIDHLQVATANVPAEEFFMTAPSPGQIARFLHNQYYENEEAYLYALADVMKAQYQAIVDAGFVLQLDCPDLALSRHTVFAHLSLEEFRKEIAMHVEALNHAVRDIPPDRMRMHICWGSTMGPHHTDVPLKDIVDVVLKGRPMALSFPGANPRHAHEWKIWKDIKLPEGKIIIPGLIDSTSNFVEHPELVAQRIVRYANVVARENMLAGVDCGFGTFAGRIQVDSKIVWLKLQALAEGSRLASQELW